MCIRLYVIVGAITVRENRGEVNVRGLCWAPLELSKCTFLLEAIEKCHSWQGSCEFKGKRQSSSSRIRGSALPWNLEKVPGEPFLVLNALFSWMFATSSLAAKKGLVVHDDGTAAAAGPCIAKYKGGKRSSQQWKKCWKRVRKICLLRASLQHRGFLPRIKDAKKRQAPFFRSKGSFALDKYVPFSSFSK